MQMLNGLLQCYRRLTGTGSSNELTPEGLREELSRTRKKLNRAGSADGRSRFVFIGSFLLMIGSVVSAYLYEAHKETRRKPEVLVYESARGLLGRINESNQGNSNEDLDELTGVLIRNIKAMEGKENIQEYLEDKEETPLRFKLFAGSLGLVILSLANGAYTKKRLKTLQDRLYRLQPLD